MLSHKVVPIIGLGTFQIKDPSSVFAALDCALNAGYRLIDTAAVYKNEHHIGACLPELLEKYHLGRADIFVTSKLGPKDLGKSSVQKALDETLHKLKLDYIDLYLIHWPGKQGIPGNDPKNKIYRKQTWLALEHISKTTSKIKHIGVSNYMCRHLKEMLDYATILPAVLQCEFHPDFQDHSVKNFCTEHNIHVQAYSSLGQSKLVEDDRFKPFALKYNKTIPQLLLRWGIQKGCSVIPKSKTPSYIRSNIDIFDFEINSFDMALISDCGKNKKIAWNPDHVV